MNDRFQSANYESVSPPSQASPGQQTVNPPTASNQPAAATPSSVPSSTPIQKPVPVSTAGVKITTTSGGKKKFQALFKLALLILLPIGLGVGGVSVALGYFAENTYRQQKGILLATPMHNTNWQDLGVIFEPLVDLSIKTTTGYEKNKFLLDSGAVISSLPREWAEKTGQDLAFLQRSTFKGFGGTTSLAYQGEMLVLLGEKEVALPVVFTEASGTKSLLGRKGFFEDYSVYFNHKEKQIEIRE